MSASKKDASEKNWKLAGSSWAGAWKTFAAAGVVGLIGAGVGYTQDARRFAFSWLFAFLTVLTVALGALFFVVIQHLTSAGWSVTVRRTAEFFALGLLVLVPLFLPVLLSMNQLFTWFGDEHGEQAAPDKGERHGSLSLDLIKPAYAEEHAPPPAEHAPPRLVGPNGEPLAAQQGHPPIGRMGAGPEDAAGHGPFGHGRPSGMHGLVPGAHAKNSAGDPHALERKEVIEKKKAVYLNKTFFLARMVLYFFVWVFLALRFFRFSTAQDSSKDPKLTVKAQSFAPAATILFAMTLTFGAFDWIMALDPMWFSTIFGVVIFAGCVVSSLALIILTTLALRDAGPLKGAVTIEHFHDLGKLMFGFLVFWAYVQFSQFMLIWYAALPEETTFFHNRWDNAPWSNVSLALILFHFAVPFFWVISRNFKRNVARLQIGAAIILVMHAVDIYWFVMPNFLPGQAGFSFHWMDAACLLAVAGIYGAFVFYRMNFYALVPVGDPRLQRSLEFTNA